MHPAPPFQMSVQRFGVWHAMTMALLGMSSVVDVAWAVSGEAQQAVAIGLLFCVLSTCAWVLVRHARALEAFSLRWDTQCWHLGAIASKGHEPLPGELIVALDAGAWMLLRFVPESGSACWQGVWLPVQRRGHESSWHALRCTVYTARPVSLPTGAEF